MRKLLRLLLKKPIAMIAERLSSSPREKEVYSALSRLLRDIRTNKKRKGIEIGIDFSKDRFIIFSDQHKGIRDGGDDFRNAEKNYLCALSYYYSRQFTFVSLGDCEELWKNTPEKVMKSNHKCFQAEKAFLISNKYYRIFGNHDLIWRYRLQQRIFLMPVFGKNLNVYEGLVLRTVHNQKEFFLFLTHGHQGDLRGVGSPFSIWVVANIWTPIQRYLGVSINTPATSFELTDKHNAIMYDWSATQHRLILISGHTHKPIFASLDYIEKLARDLEAARTAGDTDLTKSLELIIDKKKADFAGKKQIRRMAKPSYFNSGCCCFDDGDITGIEIEEGGIRLVKWETKNSDPQRIVLEQSSLQDIFENL
jgi:hypothetical protein